MLNKRHFLLVALVLGSAAAACHQDLWAVCNALNEAQSIGIPGGSGICSTVCQVEQDTANFELDCSLNDDTKSVEESSKACSTLKMLIELFVTSKFNCQVTCGNSREPHTFDLKVVCQ